MSKKTKAKDKKNPISITFETNMKVAIKILKAVMKITREEAKK